MKKLIASLFLTLVSSSVFCESYDAKLLFYHSYKYPELSGEYPIIEHGILFYYDCSPNTKLLTKRPVLILDKKYINVEFLNHSHDCPCYDDRNYDNDIINTIKVPEGTVYLWVDNHCYEVSLTKGKLHF